MAQPYVPFGYRMPFPTPEGLLPIPQASAGPMPGTMLAGPPVDDAMMPQTEAGRLDLQQQGQGAGNMLTMAAPFALAGPLMAGGRAAANLAAQFPRLATGAVGGAALTGQSTAAGPKPPQAGQDPHLQRLLETDPVLRQLQQQISEQESIANAPNGNDPARGFYPKSARDGARTRASDLQGQFNTRLGELSRANLPFDQAYPWLAQNRGLISFLAPAGVGYLTRMAGNLLSRVGPARWERSMRRADDALERGDDRSYQHFMGRAARFEPGPPSRMSEIGHATAPAVAGGTVGAELSMLPYQHNITNAPMGSPQRGEAETMLGSPMNWLPRAAYGGAIGALGGFTGGHLPNVGPGFRPPPGAPLAPVPPSPTPTPTPAVPPPVQAAIPSAQPPAPPVAPTPPPIAPTPAPPVSPLFGGRPNPGGVVDDVAGGAAPPAGATWNRQTRRWHLGNKIIGGPSRWPGHIPARRPLSDYPDE